MAELRYEYIVIGAGTAGCLIASRLAEFSNRVLLIEAGDDHSRNPSVLRPAEYLRLQRSDLDWTYRTTSIEGLAGRVLDCPRGKTLGGSSAINAMIYSEGTPQDFADWWRELGDPWSPESVAASFRELRESLAGLSFIETPRELSPPCSEFMAAAHAACRMNSVTGQPIVYDRTCRNGIRNSAALFLQGQQLTIASGFQARRLIIQDQRVTGVVMGRPRSREETRTFAEKAVVVAAGVIGTPHLLMLSGLGEKAALAEVGIAPILHCPEIGQNLTDHLAFPMVYRRRNALPFPGKWSMRDLVRWSFLGCGPIASNLAEVGGFFDLPDDYPLPADERCHAIQLHVTPTHYLRYPMDSRDAAMTIAVTATQPKSRGTVTLASDNPDEPPRIDPNYLSHPADVGAMIAGADMVRQIVQHPPLNRIADDEIIPGAYRGNAVQLDRAIRRYSMTLYHPCGTCRMGPDAGSVVDGDCQFRGLEQLFIADASVFPRIPRMNPSATIMMIAHRVADRLRSLA